MLIRAEECDTQHEQRVEHDVVDPQLGTTVARRRGVWQVYILKYA